jgi:hypothetical protein
MPPPPRQVGKPKRTDRVLLPEGLEERVVELTAARLEAAYRWVPLGVCVGEQRQRALWRG